MVHGVLLLALGIVPAIPSFAVARWAWRLPADPLPARSSVRAAMGWAVLVLLVSTLFAMFAVATPPLPGERRLLLNLLIGIALVAPLAMLGCAIALEREWRRLESAVPAVPTNADAPEPPHRRLAGTEGADPEPFGVRPVPSTAGEPPALHRGLRVGGLAASGAYVLLAVTNAVLVPREFPLRLSHLVGLYAAVRLATWVVRPAPGGTADSPMGPPEHRLFGGAVLVLGLLALADLAVAASPLLTGHRVVPMAVAEGCAALVTSMVGLVAWRRLAPKPPESR